MLMQFVKILRKIVQVQWAQFGALFNEEKWSDKDNEDSITTEDEEAAYDEFPGEDKEGLAFWRNHL